MSDRTRITFEVSEELKAEFDACIVRGVRTMVLLQLMEMVVDFTSREGDSAPYLIANGHCEIQFRKEEDTYELG